jgi:uncharacterized protein
MWQQTTQHGPNLTIFREEFEDFLPEKILDFHVHVFNSGILPDGQAYSCAGHPLFQYDLEDLKQDLAGIYPGRDTAAVCFGMPHVEYIKLENDNYIEEVCDCKQFFPLRLLDPLNDTPDTLREDLAGGRFMGVKPYLNYVRKPNLNDVEIHEMLPAWAMKAVNERGLIVMLHIPRSKRLADSLNQRQIVELCETYPRAKVVLAHIGRAYYLKNVVGQLENLKNLPNLYFDLAMVNNWEVLEYLFEQVEARKILYGTDAPIAWAPGKSVEINDQYTYVTPVPWSLSISDDHGKLKFTSFAYEEIRAIKKAVERLSLGDDFVRGLFHDHGMAILNEVLASAQS